MTSSLFAPDCDIIIPTFHTADVLERIRMEFVVATTDDYCNLIGYSGSETTTEEALVLVSLKPFPLEFQRSKRLTVKDGEGFMFVLPTPGKSRKPNLSQFNPVC